MLLIAALIATAASSMRLPSSVIHDSTVRYFAFGSNLDPSKMASRGKNASAIPYAKRWACVAHGYRLAFNMRGFPPLEPAMASIAESANDECPGCVYEMALDDYEALWRSEGGAMKKCPYREVVVRVSRPDGPDVDAVTLAAEDWCRLRSDAIPSKRYLGIIETGARSLGLEAHADALAWLRTVDDVNWTSLAPPPMIQPGERTGKYKLGGDAIVGFTISAEDYAVAAMDEIDTPKHEKARFAVAAAE